MACSRVTFVFILPFMLFKIGKLQEVPVPVFIAVLGRNEFKLAGQVTITDSRTHPNLQ
jgi:hypothetical protein